jgi:hypothetical protein
VYTDVDRAPDLNACHLTEGSRALSTSHQEDAQPVHPRVLEVGLEDHQEWALACWFDPGPDKLDAQLRRLLEVTFLAEFSQRPSLDLVDRNFEAVQLLVFDELGAESRDRLEALGFESASYVPDNYVERMSAWREEAKDEGLEIPSTPKSVFNAPISRPDPSISSKLEQIQRQMVDKLDGEVFGETPGGPSKLMASFFRQHFNVTITPDRKGLHSFELFLVQETPRTLRWMPPVLFQSLCDFVGVMLQAEHGLTVQWGMSTPDSTGFAPPPVFRVPTDGGYRQIPVGEEVIRWCVMPRSDDAPTLAEQVAKLATSDS